MSIEKCATRGGNATGARSGHASRWAGRAIVKSAAKKRRRVEDKAACKGD